MPLATPDANNNRDSTATRAALGDIAAVVLFVVIGRNNHNEGNALSGIVRVAAPFLLALLLGWFVALRVDRRPLHVRFGAVVWGITLIGGMALRRTVFGRTTAPAFVIVAALFLAMTLIGWRAVVALNARRAS